MTAKEKQMADRLEQSLKASGRLVGEHSIASDIPLEGIFLYKENDEWIVANTCRGRIEQIYGRFPKIFFASLFFIDEMFPAAIVPKVKEEFCRLLRENVIGFMDV